MSGPSTSYTLSATAYAIPILHAAQHPSSTTTGLLLGPSSSSSTSTPQVSITDAIPLQHVNTSLSPYTELGLEMVDKYAESKGMRVVGLYVARESGEGLGRTGERLLAKLKESFSDAFALELDNDRLAAGQAAYRIYLASSPSKALDNTADSLPSSFQLNADAPAQTLKAVREGRIHRTLRDLDNHLEDSTADWLENKDTKQVLKPYIS